MGKVVIGIMGPGSGATPEDCQNAYQVATLIAQQGWIVLTGGRNIGVMAAANQGAKHVNGITIGILPGSDQQELSESVDIAIITDMGSARNNINVLSSRVVVVCGMGAGTASEVALAIKAGKPVILLNPAQPSQFFFQNLSQTLVLVANDGAEVINLIKKILGDLENLQEGFFYS